MSACLCCFETSGGLLLSYQTYGPDFNDIPLPLLATLNSTHDYLTTHQAQPISLNSKNLLIQWHEFHQQRLRFILIVQQPEESTVSNVQKTTADLQQILHIISLALHFKSGLSTLFNSHDVSALKRCLTDALPLLNSIMESFLMEDDLCLSSLLNAPLVAHSLYSTKLTGIMDLFCSSMTISHSFLLVNDRFSAMSGLMAENFSGEELLLLSFYIVRSAPANTAKGRSAATADSASVRSATVNLRSLSLRLPVTEDLIFLPKTSPDFAHRLFICKLDMDITLGFLVGREFALNDTVQGQIQSFWETETDVLKRMADLPPTWMPGFLQSKMPPNLYGIVLRNFGTVRRAFYSSVSTASSKTRMEQRRSHLISFVRIVHECVFESHGPPIREMYRFFNDQKFYWFLEGEWEVWALFDASTPRQSLRALCQTALTLLTTRRNKKIQYTEPFL